MNIPVPLNIIEENERDEKIIQSNNNDDDDDNNNKDFDEIEIDVIEIDKNNNNIIKSSKDKKLRKENEEILETKLDIENNDDEGNNDDDDLDYNDYLKKHDLNVAKSIIDDQKDEIEDLIEQLSSLAIKKDSLEQKLQKKDNGKKVLRSLPEIVTDTKLFTEIISKKLVQFTEWFDILNETFIPEIRFKKKKTFDLEDETQDYFMKEINRLTSNPLIKYQMKRRGIALNKKRPDITFFPKNRHQIVNNLVGVVEIKRRELTHKTYGQTINYGIQVLNVQPFRKFVYAVLTNCNSIVFFKISKVNTDEVFCEYTPEYNLNNGEKGWNYLVTLLLQNPEQNGYNEVNFLLIPFALL
ncbi:2366_t:CDS:2 [Diversispora eburnea]|uniref:2366_t:CDS:1 n=1 Tax=Diversispora eburnea TaxID=1213867 RepID=A0A9N8V0H0_9GLOM|nr:2366_t:CDS:2 [Diversispora eburnea]